MLLHVHAQSWKKGLLAKPFDEHSAANAAQLKRIVALANSGVQRPRAWARIEASKTALEMMVANVG